MNLLILTEIFLSLVAASASAPSPMEKTEDSGVEPLDSDQIFLQVVNVPWNLVEPDNQQWSLSKPTDSRKFKAQRIREKKAKSRNRRQKSFYSSTPGRNSESSYPPSKSDYKRVPGIRKKRPNGSRRQEKKRKKSASESPSKHPNPDRPTLDFGRDAVNMDRGKYPNSAETELLRRNEGDSPDRVSPTSISPVENSPNQVSPESGSVELNEHESDRNEVQNMDFHGEELIKKVGKGIKKVFQKIKNKKEGEEEEEEEKEEKQEKEEKEKTGKKKLKNEKDEDEDGDEDEDEDEDDEDENYQGDHEIDDCDDDSEEIEDEEYESDDCDDSESDSETDTDSDSDSDSDDDCDDPIEGYKAIRIESPGSKPKIIRMKNDPKLNTFDPSKPHHSTMATTPSDSSHRDGPSGTIASTRPIHTLGPKESSKNKAQNPSSSNNEFVDRRTNHSLSVDKTKHPQKPTIHEFQPRKGDIYLPEDENEHTSGGFKYSLPIALLLGGPVMALLIM